MFAIIEPDIEKCVNGYYIKAYSVFWGEVWLSGIATKS
jgi:hypothetical protein